MNQHQKMPQWLKVSFRIMYGVDQWAIKYRWLPILCRFSEVAVLMYFQIIKTFVDLTVLLLDAPVPKFDITYQLFYLTGISFLLSLPLFAYEYHQYNDLGAVEERRTLSQIVHWCLIFLLYLNYLLYLMVGYYLWRKVTTIRDSPSFNFDLLVVFTMSVMFLFQTVLFSPRRLYGWITPLLAFMFIYLTTHMRSFVILAISVPLLYKQNRFDAILDHKLVFVTGLWSALALFEVVFNEVLLWITLIVFLVLTTAHHFLTSRPIQSLSSLQQIELLLEFYQKETEQQPQIQDEEVVHFNHQQAYLYQKYFNQIDLSLFQKASQASKIQISEWKDLKRQVLWQRILQEKYQKSSLEITVLLFQAAFTFKQNQLKALHQLQKLYLQNQEKGIRFKYWIYFVAQTILKKEQKNEENQQNNVKIADFISAETFYREFYEILDKTLTKLLQFWRQLDQNQSVVTDKVQHYLQRILKYHSKLSEKLSKLKSFKITRQIKLFDMISGIVNCYSLNKDLQREQEQSELKQVSFEYLFIKSNRITKISLKLLKQLNYQLEDIIYEKLDSFLPKNYSKYVQEQCQTFLENHEETIIMLPILAKDHCFILKQCQIHLVLEENTPSFVFSLEKWEENSPLLILNITKQTVEGINNELRQYANIKPQILRQFFDNSNILLFNSVFGTQLTQVEQNALVRGEKLKTKFSSTYELQPKQKKNRNRPQEDIDLHPLMTLAVGAEQWIISKLTSSVGSIDFAAFGQQDKIQRDNYNTELDLQKKHANETVFCPIESPFKSKILQKLSHRQKLSIKSYCCLLSIINILAVVVFLSFIIIDIILDPSDYEQINDIKDLNNEYVCLLKMYSNSYSYTFFGENQNSTEIYYNQKVFNNTATTTTLAQFYTSLLSYYLTEKEKNIKEFTSTYLLQKTIEGYTPMSYNLTFPSYQIQTSTLYSTFYDFISFPEGIDGSSTDFLVVNYQNLIHVFPAFQEYSSNADNLNQNYNIYLIAEKVTLITIGALLLIELILAAKSVKVYAEIKNVLSYVERKDVEEVLKKLDGIKLSIGEICVNEFKIAERNSYQAVSSSFRFGFEGQLEDRSVQVPSSQNLENKLKSQEQKDQKDISYGDTFLSFLKLSYFSTLILIIIMIISTFESMNLESQSQTYKAIVSLLEKYQTQEMYIQQRYTQLFQNHFYLQLKGVNYNVNTLSVSKIDFNDEYLPQIIQNDIRVDESLCIEINYEQISMPGFNNNEQQCSGLAQGVLTRGYSQARQVYEAYLREIYSNGYENYLTASSKLNQIIQLKQILTNYLKTKQSNFFSNLEEYEEEKQQKEIIDAFLLLLIVIALILFLCWYIYIQTMNRNLMGGLIRIVPTTVMYRISTTKYLQKKELLEKIEVL